MSSNDFTWKQAVLCIIVFVVILSLFGAAMYFQIQGDKTWNGVKYTTVPVNGIGKIWHGDHDTNYTTLLFNYPNGTQSSYVVSCNYYSVGSPFPLIYGAYVPYDPTSGTNNYHILYWVVNTYSLAQGCFIQP